MSERLSATIALYLLFLAAWSTLNAVRGDRGGTSWLAGLVIVWVALAVQAVAALLGVLSGDHALADPATFWGYLATSVLLLPAALPRIADGPSRAGSLAIAIVLFALAVVVWRLIVLWEAG